MLKKLLLVGAFFILCADSYGQKTAAKPVAQDKVTGAKFSLTNKDSLFDFCEIEEGDVVKHQFLFQNTGNEPLFIDNISCALHNVKFKWPTRIIKPGKTGVILVTYSSFMDVGTVSGDIYISSNASKDPIPALHIKGKIMTYEESIEEPLGKSASK